MRKQKIMAIWSKCFLKISKSWQPEFEELSPYISPDILYFFTVDADSSYCISWNTTYSELLTLNLGYLETDINGVQFYHFDIPIIVGHIKFNHAKVLWNSTSLTSPIQHYIIDIKIGFKGNDFCLILPNKIESIQIDNLRPAKGWGGCWMQIKIEGFKNSIRIYQVLDVNQLDKHVDDFSAFFGVDVVINDRGYDC